MTDQEKIDHILSQLSDLGKLQRLILIRIAEVLPLLPSARLDEIITLLEAE